MSPVINHFIFTSLSYIHSLILQTQPAPALNIDDNLKLEATLAPECTEAGKVQLKILAQLQISLVCLYLSKHIK